MITKTSAVIMHGLRMWVGLYLEEEGVWDFENMHDDLSFTAPNLDTALAAVMTFNQTEH
jgi:hypothetical protein